MTRSVIDPITRIEGHMRVEMEVQGGKVVDAWASGGSFRGMETVVEHRKPEDAAQIVQRICGVCPVSHSHSSTIAAEKAYGITIPNGARIVRNLIEGAQFMHSHILWFYQLSALDYVNPLHALEADIDKTYELCDTLGLAQTDFGALAERLTKFAENGQYSWLSGGWFLDGQAPDAYKLPAEVDLIATAHYIEAIDMQATADEISSIMGGKMPHIMTSIPGGTAFVPSVEKIDDILFRSQRLHDWVTNVMIPDAIAIAGVYLKDLTTVLPNGKLLGDNKHGNFLAYGVFDREDRKLSNRYLPAGVLLNGLSGAVEDVDESKIYEYVGTSWYKGEETYQSPYFVTDPEFTEYDVEKRYSWCKAPSYDGLALETGPLSRVLVAYVRGVPFITETVDGFLKSLGKGLGLSGAAPATAAISMLGRVALRQVESLYVAQLMKDWTLELIEAVKGGEASYFDAPLRDSGSGTGFWEAPRGALYHSEKVTGGKIDGYQIIIPTTWNMAPINQNGEHGPIEQALIGCPVEDIEKPINALRLVHSYDPCVSCAVHVSEPASGKHFETVTNPWGVK